MANCVKCGRQLPGFSFGKQKDICKWCVQHEAAQRGELPEDDVQPVMAAPWERSTTDTMFVTQLFVAMNALVFIAMAISGVSAFQPTSPELIRWGANYGPLTLGGQPWRLLSNIFLHIGIVHIALNMWCLWSLGELAESLYGHVTFAFVYLTTGIAASIASVWWRPGGVSAGASGAIFGIAGALVASYYLGDFSLPQDVVKTYLRRVVKFSAYNLVIGAMSGHIDNAAHIGGLVCGLALGAVIARIAPERENWTGRIAIYALGLVLVATPIFWLKTAKGYDVHIQNGFAALRDSDFDRALTEFQKAVAARPKDVAARIDLAHAHYQKEQFGKAEAELQAALALDPKNEEVAYRLGTVYLAEKQIARAKEAFAKLLAVNPNSAFGHYGMGMVAVDEENPQIVIGEYSRAVELEPEFTGAYYEIGRAQLKLKRYDEAIATLQKAQRLADDNPYIESALADAFTAKGMAKEAQEAKTKAAQLKAGEKNESE